MTSPLEMRRHCCYSYEIDLDSPVAKFLRSHVAFFTAFIQELTQSASPTPQYLSAEFFPLVYDYRVRLHNYHLYWCVNDFNVFTEATNDPKRKETKSFETPMESLPKSNNNIFVNVFGSEASASISLRNDSFSQVLFETIYQLNFGRFSSSLHYPPWHTLHTAIPGLDMMDVCHAEGIDLDIVTYLHSLPPRTDPSPYCDKYILNLDAFFLNFIFDKVQLFSQ
jgi:hypothetical protein